MIALAHALTGLITPLRRRILPKLASASESMSERGKGSGGLLGRVWAHAQDL